MYVHVYIYIHTIHHVEEWTHSWQTGSRLYYEKVVEKTRDCRSSAAHYSSLACLPTKSNDAGGFRKLSHSSTERV